MRAVSRTLTAIPRRDGDLLVALCPKLDTAHQGTSVEEARANLREAIELFVESADPSEVSARLRSS